MKEMEFVVDAQGMGQTAVAVLRRLMPGMSWTDARKHLRARRLLVNEVVCLDEARRVRTGDRIKLLSESGKPVPKHSDVRVEFEDESFLIIEKPAGMECERRPEQQGWSRDKRLHQLTVVESLREQGHRVWPVHRLDRDTSGVMVYAKSREAQEKLIAIFARHEIERRYRGVALGKVEPQTVKSWIARDRGDGLRGSDPQGKPGSELAITHIDVVEVIAGGKYTVVDCTLETGKTHQIRVHLAEMGHPMCGEKLYVRPKVGAEPIVDDSNAPRQALHCRVLGFTHPDTGEKLRFDSLLPADLERWLEKLKGKCGEIR